MPKPKADKSKESADLSFEKALHRLEEIVSQLEQADAPLDKALGLYEEGVKLSRLCSGQLQAAERRVEVLEDKNGSLRGRPLVDDQEDADESERGTGDDAEEIENEDPENENLDVNPRPGKKGDSQDTLF
ncbi:MAG: exodeoxyribonuclease VII small subunit [Candidatus Firestonebacteria bacterium]|nr:exodeoxyribonuclease VII small subunit [Candidatus Firestonebacteria bacterium]